MIRILTVISVLLLFALTVCGCNGKAETAKTGGPAQNAPSAAGADASKQEKDVLVVYFSATGTTKGVAEKIASLTSADLAEIIPVQPYTNEDLNYRDRTTRASAEDVESAQNRS